MRRRNAVAVAGAALALATQGWSQSPPPAVPRIVVPPGSGAVEQTSFGTRPAAALVASFDGLGAGFTGPQGSALLRNPSDNSLAVGPNHIVQLVNTRMAIFRKDGTPLYGPVPTNNVFKGFGGACESRNNGDAVVRYDQLADRWLIVMPLFSRAAERPDQPDVWKGGEPAHVSPAGRPGQPGPAAPLYQPPRVPPGTPPDASAQNRAAGRRDDSPRGPYSMCYAVSSSPDPLGSYYRYEFLRPLFPDYPRPAIWSDGYYVPTSTSDDRISEQVATQKHACVADRTKMIRGEPATEQCVVIENVNFLNNADIDGRSLPPAGAPNVMLAAGGRQLDQIFEADSIDVWRFHVDWQHASKTAVTGPAQIRVAPYHYLCDGQLSNCVPQPGIDRRLDAQGDKIMARIAYRRIGNRESIVAVHAVNTTAGGGGIRWYEFRIDARRDVTLYQQGTYAPDRFYRWLASPAIDRLGNIGIGYSFGGAPHFPGQRFAGRLAADPPGSLTLRETVLVGGAASQDATRWEDYTQTAIDPSDDCTIWYVGDYLQKGVETYSSKIGAFRMAGCGG
ncbi:MAG TPA: hypothetical protein VKE51_21630 [Vicinamibacterales bacterium]|nr:hypothetical protein [Vicinamibacterales bacterium]